MHTYSKHTYATEDFPVGLLRHLLGDLYCIVFTLLLCPRELGYPVQRRRRFTLLRLHEGTEFTGHIHSFLGMFCSQLQVSGSQLLVASDSEVALELERHRKESASFPASVFQDCIPGSMRVRIGEHTKLEPQAEDVIFDMNQNAGWSSVGFTFPCMTKNNVFWSTAKNRPILAKEHLFAQGRAFL